MAPVSEVVESRQASERDVAPPYATSMTSDAFLSLGCMEGLFEAIVAPATKAEILAPPRVLLWPGYALAALVAAMAYALHFAPVAPFTVADSGGIRRPVSAALLAILVGGLLGNTLPVPDSARAGLRHTVKKVIPLAIVLTGAGLDLSRILSIGASALLVTAVCIAVALAATYQVGRALGLRSKTALLLGAGTGICGNSAIVAVAPLVDAEEDDIALAAGTVNLFGLLAMLAWPVIGTWLALGEVSYGVWAGTSIHAVPQVVAAGFAYGPTAGALATLVKLVRVTMLAPMIFAVAFFYARQRQETPTSQGDLTVRYTRLVPWFVWGFVACAVLNTLGLFPILSFPLADAFSSITMPVSISMQSALSEVGKILLTFAMAAIGLEVNVRRLAGVGGSALAAGLLSTIILAAASLLLVLLLL